MPQATAPPRATAVQTAIRRGVQRPVVEVAVAVTAILLWAGPGLRMASRAGHGGHQGVGWPCARTAPAVDLDAAPDQHRVGAPVSEHQRPVVLRPEPHERRRTLRLPTGRAAQADLARDRATHRQPDPVEDQHLGRSQLALRPGADPDNGRVRGPDVPHGQQPPPNGARLLPRVSAVKSSITGPGSALPRGADRSKGTTRLAIRSPARPSPRGCAGARSGTRAGPSPVVSHLTLDRAGSWLTLSRAGVSTRATLTSRGGGATRKRWRPQVGSETDCMGRG